MVRTNKHIFGPQTQPHGVQEDRSPHTRLRIISFRGKNQSEPTSSELNSCRLAALLLLATEFLLSWFRYYTLKMFITSLLYLACTLNIVNANNEFLVPPAAGIDVPISSQLIIKWKCDDCETTSIRLDIWQDKRRQLGTRDFARYAMCSKLHFPFFMLSSFCRRRRKLGSFWKL